MSYRDPDLTAENERLRTRVNELERERSSRYDMLKDPSTRFTIGLLSVSGFGMDVAYVLFGNSVPQRVFYGLLVPVSLYWIAASLRGRRDWWRRW